MRSIATITSIACSALLILSGPVFADAATVRTLAGISMHLQHFPGEADKQKLAAITAADDSSAAEKAVASALARFEHHVTPADKEKLEAVAADESVPADLRTVAGILVTVNHTPSAADAETLDKIVSGAGS